MTEQIVKFETAKLAQEKGFDVFSKFGQDISLFTKDGEHTYYANYGFMYSGLSDGYIPAPTQSIMQRWLRENHDIDVWAKPFILENMEKEYLGFINFLPNASNGKNYTTHKTYEEAIEFGIQKALESL